MPQNLVDEAYDLEYGSVTLTMQASTLLAIRSILLTDDRLVAGGKVLVANRY